LKKKKVLGAKIRKNNKIWGKILIFLILFFGEPWGLGPGPPSPLVTPPLIPMNRLLPNKVMIIL